MTIRNLGLEVELKHVDFQKGDNKTEEYRKLNPLCQVPVLVEDDGFVLTESRAIAAYLVNSRQPDSPLYPVDPVRRAVIDQRLYYDASVVFQSHIDILVKTFDEGGLLASFIAFPITPKASDGKVRRPANTCRQKGTHEDGAVDSRLVR